MTSGQRGKRSERDEVDEASEDSFPASDPPSYSGITGDGHPDKTRSRETEDEPTGTPTSDRHATETTHQREDQVDPQAPARGRG